MQWYLKVLQDYVTFTGRARRTELWMFLLISAIVSVVLSLLDLLTGLQVALGFAPLSSIYALFVLAPSLAVGARRLHDTGRSGWWQLISLIPIVGIIILIVFWAQDGTRGPNARGADPKAVGQYPMSPS